MALNGEVDRVPVTQEYMVEVMVRDTAHPAKQSFQRALYDSIIRMVIGLANGYAVNSIDEADDLVQECMKRIMTNLHNYDSEKAKFSTWAYRVSKSVLNRKYTQGSKYSNTFVQMKDGWDAGAREKTTSAVACSEITDVVRELIKEFPKKRHILFAMFGDPESDDYILPDTIDVTETARKAGVSYGQTHQFYCRSVRPFFKKRFSKEDFNA